jgi:glycine cleavage system P protein (glycine dehydrogenase) subunit 1
VVEAVLLAVGPSGRGEVLVSRALDPQYRATLRTYAWARGFTVREIGLADGVTSSVELEAALGPDTRAVIVQQPNFLGALEDVHAIERLTHKTKALFVVAVTEPASLGVVAAPGSYNADIVAGEGQSMGSPIGYGGPALGLFATRADLMRRLPGRLVGRTVDDRGQTGYVLTLQTREQHIRRERATSNICTNHSLCALAATVYLSLLGRQGLRELAERNVELAHHAAAALERHGLALKFKGLFFNEFAITVNDAARALDAAERRGILAGVALGTDYPELTDSILISVTELNDGNQIDRLAEALAEVR